MTDPFIELPLPPPGTKITRSHLAGQHLVQGDIVGPQGPPGDDGADGVQGLQGIQGPPGADGDDGAAGSQGIQGIQGIPGNDGAQGVQGIAGIVSVLSNTICSALVGNQVWTNMPAALSFWFSSATVCKSVRRIDLTAYTQVRLRVVKLGVAGAAASKLILRYKASPWTQVVANYSDIGTSEVSVAVNVQNIFLDTGWINLPAGAKADVFVALLGSGGDGALDPVFGDIVAEFK